MQCRLGRVALGWTLDALAAASGVNRTSILRFELGESKPHPRNVQALRETMEAAGIRFIDSGEYTGGIVPPA